MRMLLLAAVLMSVAVPSVAETPYERGKYLMESVVACGNCHTPRGRQGPAVDRELSGGAAFKEPFGIAVASNLTPDPGTGLGRWTDEQIVTAIREGRRPDGSIIGPPMPIGLYRGMSDADVRAIVAYLRAVKPVVNAVPRSMYTVPLPPDYGPPLGSVTAPPRSDTLAYGAYLAGPLGHCIECHSTPDARGIPDVVGKPGGGGMEFSGPWGVVRAPALTPSALGNWTDAQIRTAVKTGVRPDGRRLGPPMGYAYYNRMRDEDLDAIVAYLRSLKPL